MDLGFASDLIAASTYDKYSVDLSIRPICTRCCLTMTDMIQVCSNFHCARVFIAKIRLNKILMHYPTGSELRLQSSGFGVMDLCISRSISPHGYELGLSLAT